MTQTTARIKSKGKHFEIVVDLDEALKFRKGESDWLEVGGDRIFTDVKKGDAASEKDLKEVFGTTNATEIGKKIVKDGEVLTTQEHRDAEQEKKFRQVVDFFARNAINPQTGNPHTPDRIEKALEEARVNIKNIPVENQVKDILEALSRILPIKLEMKKVKVTIPAIHTGKIYNLISQYKEQENWMNDGSLEVVVSIPSGMIMDFYDKLNSATHGSALTQEIKE
ncbi:MAG: ribosome assembly factor SBDS [Candidatus Nanoarchaeia archaeon]|nr:ribosome assembly factor SBDS [Candidatus Nanoarchaeia archaeon]MDD5357653.1 ribosome assembly factor SBDS [Candidatus Nanoarchaeia archaeon]MDD5588572.1 ribosome assembly factor SBDS [Candidatus Nanoarchaeia archaeon]